MHSYRVNLPLLIGLVVGTAALAGGSYGLYKYQKSRNASRLLERADAARESGDLKKTAKLLYNYLQVRPGDEEAMVELANTFADIAEELNAERKDIGNAIGQMETTVREYPDRVDLRRRLVDLYMSRRVRALKPALDHVSQLLARNPGDAELEEMRSQCYFAVADPKRVDHACKLVGYDLVEEAFDAEKAVAPGEVGVYARLANALLNDRSEPEMAEQVINQMVEANPESGEALLLRGQYYEQNEREEEAFADIQKALELEPENTPVVVSNARLALKDERYEDALALLKARAEQDPDDASLYQTLAEVAIRQGEYEQALAYCDEGIAAVTPDQAQLLLFQKARLQLQSDDPQSVQSTIKEMREGEMIASAYPDYLEARLLMSEGKWFDAAKTFEEYQSFMSAVPTMGVELNVMLGLCREKLGQDELALDAFTRAVQIDPTNEMASLSRQRLLGKIGGDNKRNNEGVSIYRALALELAKPENEQDWQAFDQLSEDYVERMKLGEGMLAVLRGEVFMRRGMYAEARKQLIKAYKLDPENLNVRRAAVKLFAADPGQGPVKALKLLDKVVDDFGDMPILRLERADLLTVINDEDVTEQLFALADGIEDWDTDKKVQLWKGLAEKFARLRNEEARLQCLDRVAELSPGDLETMLRLFLVAREADDADGMARAQQRVLDVVGSKNDPTWLYTEAQRVLSEYRTSGGQGSGLDDATELVEKALAERRDWSELHTLKGDIALLRGEVQKSLASYDRAAELGRQSPRSLYKHVKLLIRRGRYADALEQMEKIAASGRLQLLGQEYADSLLRVGRTAEAISAAEEYAAAAPNNAAAQLWTGQFFSRASGSGDLGSERQADMVAKAGEAFDKAVESNPQNPEAWLALVRYHAATRDPIGAEDTIREAQLAIPEDQGLLLFARCYELVGRAIDAEALYKLALEQAEPADQIRVARLLAQFYLGPAYQRPDQVAKATPLINQVLRSAEEEGVDANNPHVRWARSSAAKLLASSGQYQHLLDAERLLASNVTGEGLPLQDRMLMVEILAPRPEPVSRLKAANLLEELAENQRLSQKAELDLAKLYFSLDEWRKCREQMLDVIGRYPDAPNVRIAYIEMLLQRGGPNEIDLAVRQVKRLQELAPKDLATREMLARVAFEKGKKKQAVKTMLSLLPRDLSKLTQEQVPVLKRVAARVGSFDDTDTALRLWELISKLGGSSDKLTHAQFIGQYIDGEDGLRRLEELRGDTEAREMVQRGLAILRAREEAGEELTDSMIGVVQGWLDRGLREDPDRIALKLQNAELMDLQRRYDDAAAAYRELLERDDLTGTNRAVVLNNLSYLLALANSDKASIDAAREYIAEAVTLLGPNTDILDTRAVVAIADKRFDDAIADLKLAVIDRPTPLKYFHLSYAQLMSGRGDEAQATWNEAVRRGLTREAVSRLEKEQFDQAKQQLGGVELTSVGP